MIELQPTYHKIQSVYKRDPNNHYKTFLIGEWAEPEFGYLSELQWEATEKVDGTNCRIHVGETETIIGGRTRNSQLHVDLVNCMNDIARRAVRQNLAGLTLYGEGYGAGIQKGGGDYRPNKGFILFDVMVTETGVFLERGNVLDIARKLDISSVPLLRVGIGTLGEAVHIFRGDSDVPSSLKNGNVEGWVLRPLTELRTRLGRRVITKLKVKDFPERTNQ